MIRKQSTDLVHAEVPLLAEALAIVLFIGMIAVWAIVIIGAP